MTFRLRRDDGEYFVVTKKGMLVAKIFKDGKKWAVRLIGWESHITCSLYKTRKLALNSVIESYPFS